MPASFCANRGGTPTSWWLPTPGCWGPRPRLGAARRDRALTRSSLPRRIARGVLKVLHIPTARAVIAGQPDARNAAVRIGMLDRAATGA